MVLLGLMFDVAKKALTNKYVLAALIGAALFFGGYIKGVNHEKAKQAAREAEERAQQQEEIAHSEEVKYELEVAHDKRVRAILFRDVPDADAARMLSHWPDEAAPVAAP